MQQRNVPSLLDQIRERVLYGEVTPGDLLPETALAEEFGVSRTPIREALKQLEREGLVEIRPRVGTFVRRPDGREVLELFQLKETLEGLAASLLAQRGEVQELLDLEQNIIASREAVRQGDQDRYAFLVHEFHNKIIVGADNQKLTEHYNLLLNQLAYHRIVTQTLQTPGRLERSLREHEEIVEQIRSKNPLAAELATRRHVSQTREMATLARFQEETK